MASSGIAELLAELDDFDGVTVGGLSKALDSIYRHAQRAQAIEAELTEALDACLEYLEGRVDVVDGDYGVPSPNREMQLQTAIKSALENAGAL